MRRARKKKSLKQTIGDIRWPYIPPASEDFARSSLSWLLHYIRGIRRILKNRSPPPRSSPKVRLRSPKSLLAKWCVLRKVPHAILLRGFSCWGVTEIGFFKSAIESYCTSYYDCNLTIVRGGIPFKDTLFSSVRGGDYRFLILLGMPSWRIIFVLAPLL